MKYKANMSQLEGQLYCITQIYETASSMVTPCTYVVPKTIFLQYITHLVTPVDTGFRAISGFRTSRLSNPIVCPPLSSDDQGSNVRNR